MSDLVSTIEPFLSSAVHVFSEVSFLGEEHIYVRFYISVCMHFLTSVAPTFCEFLRALSDGELFSQMRYSTGQLYSDVLVLVTYIFTVLFG